MRLETFRAPNLRRVSALVREALGEDAMIVRNGVVQTDEGRMVEIVAIPAADVEAFRLRLEPAPLAQVRANVARIRQRPFVLAVVGPTGAGKTTTAAKLAVHPMAFGGRRVGFLTLDTYRVGAVDQLQMVASIARTPLEVVYDVREVDAAMRRLAAAGCEVILIDTPGRSPRAQELNAEWRSLLQAARPDETHLVLPAAMRPDVAMAMKAGFATPRLTHLLFSKLDELPTDAGLADLAHRVGLPTRWLTDGQTIPDDLRPAPARILTSLTASEIEPAAVLA